MQSCLKTLAEGVAMFNARTGRETEMRGQTSFDDVFEREYARTICVSQPKNKTDVTACRGGERFTQRRVYALKLAAPKGAKTFITTWH